MGGFYMAVFYFYVAFSIFVMLNVISAIFIDSTMQRSKSDRDFVVHQEMSGRREFMHNMEVLFDELDPLGTGKIGMIDFQKYIMDPKANAYFRAIDLNVFKVKRLFQLMDVNHSGDIDRDEFTRGCSRLKGDAKELDLAILQYEVDKLSASVDQIQKILFSLGDRIDESLREAVRGDRA